MSSNTDKTEWQQRRAEMERELFGFEFDHSDEASQRPPLPKTLYDDEGNRVFTLTDRDE